MDFNIRSCNTSPRLFFCGKSNHQGGLAILGEISEYYPLVINDFNDNHNIQTTEISLASHLSYLPDQLRLNETNKHLSTLRDNP